LTRHTRYQGAIIRDHQILLIRHRQHVTGIEYWVIPGGGLDLHESEEECVDEPSHPDGPYAWIKTYLCRPVSGVAGPGFEPEPDAAAEYSISDVRWFDLRDEFGWDEDLRQDPFTYPQLVRLREILDYT
jgi:hypothetical protein